jgi:hypothetical protein
VLAKITTTTFVPLTGPPHSCCSAVARLRGRETLRFFD